MDKLETSNTEVITSSNSDYFQNPVKTRSKILIVLILVVFILTGAVSFSIFKGNNGKNPSKINPTQTPSQTSSNMIVYGVWKDNKSYIKAFDTGLKKEYIIAILPVNIKKVKILSQSKLLYIGNTDNKDHGENLSIYDTLSKISQIVYVPENGFKTDDYVISKNKRYVATWEVSFKEGSDVLLGGKSRVASIDLSNPGIKNIIYDELSTRDSPVHYPRAILSDGTIFLDTFLPNSGAGWAFGMSISNLSGTKKEDISNMKNGTYGTQPSISREENYLVFSGYSATDGAQIENSFRKSILSPNTIELLNTKSKERIKISNISSENTYPLSFFDDISGIIIFSQISKEIDKTGLFSYNILTNFINKIPTQNSFISYITINSMLVGNKSQTISSFGNLGDSYSSSYSNFSILDNRTNRTTPVKLTDNFMQFISIAHPGFFEKKEGIDILSDKTLQLQTFNFKPSLGPAREKQQAEVIPEVNPEPDVPQLPPCLSLLLNQCSDMNSSSNDIRSKQHARSCQAQMERMVNQGLCMDSPLYLYGNPGTLINVKVNTYVYSSDPFYDSKTGYNIKLLKDGEMEIDGKTYDRINYDYISKKVNSPINGIVASREKLKETLEYLALNLGLNKKETENLTEYGNTNIKSPFVFVSFYDQKTSEQILPLEFNPKPDTYINIVFYFKEYKEKPEISTKPLEFNVPFKRGIFTVVEISEILE